MKKRLLFIDDDSFVLAALRRRLWSSRFEWDMSFAESAEDALAQMATCPFDVVVTDMRMPGMDGEQLLTKVRERFPSTVRIVLSGESEQGAVARAIGQAHRYLRKPCDAEELEQVLAAACRE